MTLQRVTFYCQSEVKCLCAFHCSTCSSFTARIHISISEFTVSAEGVQLSMIMKHAVFLLQVWCRICRLFQDMTNTQQQNKELILDCGTHSMIWGTDLLGIQTFDYQNCLNSC